MPHRNPARVPVLLTLVSTLTLTLSACEPTLTTPPGQVTQAIQLRQALELDDLEAVGVTVDAETGQVFVLEAWKGIYELLPDGTATLVAAADALPTPDVPLQSEFTDIAVLGDGVFALTAAADGYLLDLNEDTLHQHFCYEPGWEEEPLYQVTHSLDYDPTTDILYAQPQTFSDVDGSLVSAQVGQWAAQDGFDLAWHALQDANFVAGGLAADGEGSLILGRGSELHRFSLVDASFEPLGDLSSYGITDIQGLAWDRTERELLVIDEASDQLFRIDLEN